MTSKILAPVHSATYCSFNIAFRILNLYYSQFYKVTSHRRHVVSDENNNHTIILRAFIVSISNPTKIGLCLFFDISKALCFNCVALLSNKHLNVGSGITYIHYFAGYQGKIVKQSSYYFHQKDVAKFIQGHDTSAQLCDVDIYARRLSTVHTLWSKTISISQLLCCVFKQIKPQN